MTDETVSSNPAYLRREAALAQAAPITTSGPIAWVRAHLLSGWLSAILSLIFVIFLVWAVPDLIRFFFIDAVWSATDGTACRAPGTGACWAFIARKIDFFRYGSYPSDFHWRVDLTLMIGAVLAARLLWPSGKKGIAGLAVFILGVPLLMFLLIPGVAAVLRDPATEITILGIGVGLAALLEATALSTGLVALLFFAAYPVLVVILLHGSVTFGLPMVDTNLWGGIFVSLLVATIGIVVSLPVGVMLALGRRSRLPIVRFFSVIFIEFVRGVPFITVLFMANTMLPLFVPEYLTPDRLLRPLIGVALFASAYMAEEIRGGLQAMPKGQYEGAMALGLGYSQMMRLVVLPQALTLVIPGIVNIFIGLFKDTTLVAIVGVFDFLRTVDTARVDPAWSGPSISATGYAFAALFYFVFCFGMSRYSLMMERRLSAGRAH
ncbi:MAG: amino transporter, permease, region, His/Glu/Gln/Arg/opine family domain protein [Hyphomicrobiales bacterium]|nr:amino transporter, permease, region, His/Glu/Gln/Arg/opine family domain protein [Hyphomicrobiales bacterium]